MKRRASMTFGKLGQAKPRPQVQASLAPVGNGFTGSPFMYPTVPDSPQRGGRPGNLDAPTWSQIPQTRQRAMLQDARALYAGAGLVKGACGKLADYTVGWAWQPRYTGDDERFREIAELVIHGWLNSCDVRGGQHNWRVGLRTACISIDRDGDVFAVLTKDPDTGGPRIQWIEADRVGQPIGAASMTQFGKVPDLPETNGFVGMDCSCGVVFDPNMRPVAFNILPNAGVGLPMTWNLVPAESVVWFYDAVSFSQARGIPSICHGVLDWYDLQETVAAEKIAAKVNSSLALIEKNETGRRELGKEAIGALNLPTTGRSGLETQTFEKGLIRYIKTTGSIEAHRSDRPGSGWLALMEHLTRSAFAGMSLPMEFVWDSSKIGGAGVRSMVGQVQRTVENRQHVLYGPAMQMLLYGVSSYMQRGDIPFAADWFKWDFSLPPLYSVDMGRDSQNRREDFAVGIRSLRSILAEDSIDVRDHLQQRADDYILARDIAAQRGIPIEAILNPNKVTAPPEIVAAPAA